MVHKSRGCGTDLAEGVEVSRKQPYGSENVKKDTKSVASRMNRFKAPKHTEVAHNKTPPTVNYITLIFLRLIIRDTASTWDSRSIKQVGDTGLEF